MALARRTYSIYMEYVIITGVVVALILFIFMQQYVNYKKYEKTVLEKIDKQFGCKSQRYYSKDELDNIKKFFDTYKDYDSIDDITSYDLDIDSLYTTFNVSNSAPGDDYFYYRLRTKDSNSTIDKENKIKYISSNSEVRKTLFSFFYRIGRMRKISFIDFINLIDDIDAVRYTYEFIYPILFAISIILIFVSTEIGIIALIAVSVINILTYYKKRGDIEPYIIGFGYINNFISICRNCPKLENTPVSSDIQEIRNTAYALKSINRSFNIIGVSKQTGSGNPLDIIMDYFRMLLHIDVINFYKTLVFIKTNIGTIKDLYFKIGELESYINISSLRCALGDTCIPSFEYDGIKATNIYHPLIDNPVKNDIDVCKNVLITGSNASGKSTFLRAIAINLILGQTINTCCADSFASSDYSVFSSMSVKDDLLNGDSYFMAEIKAFKRIIDYANKNKDKRVIAFTDELLRGTNTVERVAACTAILRSLADNNIFAFAATHDIELTDLLSDDYLNYHFDEDFVDDDVIFNYKFKEGKATSKNAIKLLEVMGFDENITKDAARLSDEFIASGKWNKNR